MGTSKWQRLGIWIITIVMTLGTVAGFIAMMVAPQNAAKDQAELEKLRTAYQKDIEKWREKLKAQAAELSTRYYGQFSPYASRVGEFNPEAVKELGKEDIVVGEGAEIKDDTEFAVYYIGWNPRGEIFDQSIDGEQLKAPFVIDGPKNAGVINGWREGLVGMKIGGVRELTIPADQAYGETGQGDKIPANTPLKFVVMVIEKPADIPQPEMSNELKKAYGIL